MSAPANSVAFSDVLDCMATAVIALESGRSERAEAALLEASLAAPGAFPAGSREAGALALLLGAAGQVPEAEAA